MNNKDYNQMLFVLISALKAKTTYLKTMDANDSSYNEMFYDGMALAYHMVMDEIIIQLEENKISPEQFGLQDYDPSEILSYKPLNYKKQ